MTKEQTHSLFLEKALSPTSRWSGTWCSSTESTHCLPWVWFSYSIVKMDLKSRTRRASWLIQPLATWSLLIVIVQVSIMPISYLLKLAVNKERFRRTFGLAQFLGPMSWTTRQNLATVDLVTRFQTSKVAPEWLIRRVSELGGYRTVPARISASSNSPTFSRMQMCQKTAWVQWLASTYSTSACCPTLRFLRTTALASWQDCSTRCSSQCCML